MSLHSSHMAEMAVHIDALGAGDPEGRVTMARLGLEKHAKAREVFLPFLLHLADISNPTRPKDVSVEWAEGAYNELFLQGDRELAEGLPVSPLCDRNTTSRPESQVRFMKSMIKPAFKLLARCFPQVESNVLMHLEENVDYWEGALAETEALAGQRQQEKKGRTLPTYLA